MNPQTLERVAEVLFDARLEMAVAAGESSPYYRQIPGSPKAIESDYFAALPEGKKDVWRDRARVAVEQIP